MKKKSRMMAILLVMVIFVVIAAIGLFQNQVQSYPKEAKDYFQVVEAGVINAKPEDNGTVWILYGVSITFKAVAGDAHAVVVQSWAGSDAQEVGDMRRDAPQTVSLLSPQGLAIKKDSEGFPVTIRITSLEASGKVTFHIKE